MASESESTSANSLSVSPSQSVADDGKSVEAVVKPASFADFVAQATRGLEGAPQPRTSSPLQSPTLPTELYRVPLDQISQTLTGRWFILGRVTAKSALQTYKRVRTGGQGAVASAQLCDDTYRARVVAFDDLAAQLHGLTIGRVYKFTGLDVKVMPKVTVVSPDQLQMHFTAHTTWVEEPSPLYDQFPDIYATPVDFSKLPQFLGTFQTADIFGILITVGAVQTMRSSKTGLTFTKQVVGLGNQHGEAVQVVLWGANIARWTTEHLHQVFAITDIVVKNGQNDKFCLASGRLSEVVDISETEWERGRALLAFQQSDTYASQIWRYLTTDSYFQTALNLKVLAVLDAASRDRRAQTNYDVVAEVHTFATTPRPYKMCPTPGCKRSLAADACRVDTDQFKCPGCSATCQSAQLGVGYCAEVVIGDATFRANALLFNENVAALVGRTLTEFKANQDANDQDYYAALRRSHFKWFLMRIGFGNDRRMVVNALRPVDDEEAVKLYEELMRKNDEGLERVIEEIID